MDVWMIMLAIAIIAMLVGPVMMLQPSSSQRIEEALRARARALGLRVAIMSLPRQATDTDTPSAMPIYCLPHLQQPDAGVTEWLLLRAAYKHAAHFMETWEWHGKGRATEREQLLLQQLLPQLPTSVSAIGVGPQGYCCYWSERGGIETLERLNAILQNLRNGQVNISYERS